MNNSTSGGYIQPVTPSQFPKNLNLVQFLQTVLVGVSNIPGPLVRPDWQPEPPKQPDITVNWLAFGITEDTPDANGFVGTNLDGSTSYQRQTGLEISCHFYGPAALENAGLVRDGLQIQQNLDALRSANMGFTNVTPARHIPDLVNERWCDRWIMSIFLRREVQRFYPILPILSAQGTIHTVLGNEEYLLQFTSENAQ